MSKSILLFCTGILLILLSVSCNKNRCDDPCNPQCKNFDPCCGQSPPDASFSIFEVLTRPGSFHYSDTLFLEADTIVNNRLIKLKALDQTANYYEWRVQDDSRVWYGKEVVMSFLAPANYTPRFITLKVYKSFDKKCHPDAPDTATSSKSLITVPRDSSLIWDKTFIGYTKDNPTRPKKFLLQKGGFDIYNFRKDTIYAVFPGCKHVIDGEISLGYRSVIYIRQLLYNCCLDISFRGYLKSPDHIYLHMTHRPHLEGDTCQRNFDVPFNVTEFNGFLSN